MATLRFNRQCKRWQIRWYVTNKQSGEVDKGSKILPPKTKKSEAKKALEYYLEREKKIRLNGFSQKDNIAETKQLYLLYAKNFTQRTLCHYQMVLDKFCSPIKNLNLDEVKPLHIQNYLSNLAAAGYSNRTINAHLTPIKSFFRWISRTYKIANPAEMVSMLKEPPPNQRFLTDEEFNLITSSAKSDLRSWLLFIANTGLRVTEFCNLKNTDIQLAARRMTIIGKGLKRRNIPLNPAAINILRQAEATSLFTFTKNNQQLSRRYIQWRCQKLAAELKITSFGPHAFRHYFATKLIIQNVPINVVAKILGHSSAKTTEQIYLHLADKDLAGVTDNLSFTPA